MRAIVVGADGFAGRWLVRHLSDSGDNVAGLVGARYRPPLDGAVEAVAVDVKSYDGMADEIRKFEPDVVYYLAAVSQAGSRERLADAARIGLVGAIHALAAAGELEHPPRFLFVSSAHVYGRIGNRTLTEAEPTEPSTVYGAAKLAAERALLALGPAAGVGVVIARPFNHIGPGQADHFVVPSLAAQVRVIPRGGRGVVEVERPAMRRDFTDVRDVAAAYRLVATEGIAGQVYNVASGSDVSIGEIVHLMADVAGVSVDIQAPRVAAPRADEPEALVGDASRLRSLGWAARRSLRSTIADILA